MKEKQTAVPSIKKIMRIYTGFFIAAIVLFIAISITMAILTYCFNISNIKNFIIIEVSVFLALSLAVAVMLVLAIIKLYKICYKGLFITSKNLIDDIAIDKKVFRRYPENLALEFQDLNASLQKTEDHLSKIVVYSTSVDYSSLQFNYSNKELGIIEYESFISNIAEIIMLSETYRNAFLYITYGDSMGSLFGQSIKEVIKNIHKYLNYPNLLIADTQDKTGFYVYIPNIDSMNRLTEEAEMFLKNSSMVKNGYNGKTIVAAKTSIVIYPYSNIDDIISDLHYAARQGKNINLYLPDRLNKRNNKHVLHNSLTLNKVNQITTNLGAINVYDSPKQVVKNEIAKQLRGFAAYINADYTGVIIRDDDIDKYINFIALNNVDEKLFKEDQFISPTFLQNIANVCDYEGTYFFSNRVHLNSEIGSFLDKLRISSGHLYVIKDDNGPLALVYFLNRKKDMILDSYLRQAAYAISYQIGTLIKESAHTNKLKEAQERSDIIMKLSNYMLYGIDKRTHIIQYSSQTLKDNFGNVDQKPCYKALYEFDKPCENCPLLTNKKMYVSVGDDRYETSLPLKGNRENVVRMLVKQVGKDQLEHNRFDTDFLINSYYSLYEDLKNIFLSQGKGYVLLLSINNYKDLLEHYGNEGYLRYVRKFTDALNEKLPRSIKYYVYNNSTIALIIPDIGRTEIIDISEKIFEVSKAQLVETEDESFIPLAINYTAAKYPQEYSSQVDFLRYLERAVSSYDHNQYVDYIYFESTKYFRCASRRAFINEVIDKSFKDKTFKVKLQPMIASSSKHIMGAEMLIRLSDDYRNQAIGADEVIRVAAEEKKIGIISDALTDVIGDIYQNYGTSIFKSHDFTRLSLNTDYSYFSDDNFLPKISELMNKYYFPAYFLAFEINESELNDHYDFFKDICGKIKQIGVYMVVDQYTGKYLSIEKIRDLGISEIKIPRSIVRDIDVNKNSFNQVAALVNEANKYNVKVALVGIENKDQYFMVRDICKDSIVQGYYFYAPLDIGELIENIKLG